MSKGAYRDAELADLYRDFNQETISEDDFIAGCMRLDHVPQKKRLTRKLGGSLPPTCPACHQPLPKPEICPACHRRL